MNNILYNIKEGLVIAKKNDLDVLINQRNRVSKKIKAVREEIKQLSKNK